MASGGTPLRGAGRWLWAGLASSLLSAAALAAPAGAAVSVESDPPLIPRYAAKVSDYAVDCAGQPVTITAAARGPHSLSVDGVEAGGTPSEHAVELRRGERFEIKVRRGSRSRTHHVRCLPRGYNKYSFRRIRPPARELYAYTPVLGPIGDDPAFATIFDDRGTPMWWFRQGDSLPVDLRVLSDGSVAFGYALRRTDDIGYDIRALDGKRLRLLDTVGSPADFHDLIELGGGRFLMMTYRIRRGVDLSEYGGPSNAAIYDSEVQLIGSRGRLLWSWNSTDHIDFDETRRWWPTVIASPDQAEGVGDVYDPTHINAFELDGDGLMISLRHTDAIYKISLETGEVLWKLGGTRRPESLGVRGDPQRPRMFGGPHDVRMAGKQKITIHDNGTMRDYAPRALHYKLNERRGFARLLEQRTDPRAPESRCCGSSRLTDGYWTINWGGSTNFVTEFDPEGRRTFLLETPERFTYRAVPIEPELVSDAELRAGMDAMFPRQPPECGAEEYRPGPAGSLGDDRLRGGRRREFLLGLAGADRIDGRGRRDCLIGDAGPDQLAGGRGKDLMLGGRGRDRLRGGEDSDEIYGGARNDRIVGGPGVDRIDCGAGRRDTVIVEGRDVIAANCERRIRRG